LLLVPVKSFEVRVQRTLSNLIDEIGNTGRGGKLSIISFVERKLNPNNEGFASQTEMHCSRIRPLLRGLVVWSWSAVCFCAAVTGHVEPSAADGCQLGAYRLPDGEIVDIRRSEGDTLRWRNSRAQPVFCIRSKMARGQAHSDGRIAPMGTQCPSLIARAVKSNSTVRKLAAFRLM
jgi:hypothetical protein